MTEGLGAIGIARAFLSRSQLLGQMDWYYRLNTVTARGLAEDRHAFMERFVAQAREGTAIDG